MKYVTINGEKLDIINGLRSQYNFYYHRGVLLDELPANKQVVSYVKTYQDDYIGIVRTQYSLWNDLNRGVRIGIIGTASTLLILLCILLYFKISPKEISGLTPTKIDLSDKTVSDKTLLKTDVVILKYRKFVSYVNGSIDICIVNGEEPAIIYVTGEGVSSEETAVEAETELYYLPIQIDSKEELIPAKLHYKIKESDERVYDITIENQLQQAIDEDKDTTFQYEEVITE